MQLNLDIKKLPVIILSSVRTGSTAVGYELQNYLGLDKVEFFDEILTWKDYKKDELKTFLSFLDSNNNNYILKAHAWDFLKSYGSAVYPKDIRKLALFHKCTVIRLRRKNVVQQALSYYIARITNKWHHTASESDKPDITLDHHLLYECVSYVMLQNTLLDHAPIEFNYDLFYEDIEFTNTKTVQTPKPNNYLKLYNLTENLMTKYLKCKSDNTSISIYDKVDIKQIVKGFVDDLQT